MATEPGKYIHGHSPAVLSAHGRRTAQRDAAYLVPHIKPDSHILDVGAGPGSISADFAELAPHGTVTCFEISVTALAAAKKTFAERGISNVVFESGDVTDRLPFDDATFDIVHAHQVLIHIPRALEAVREMKRVLKPGGVLALKDMLVSSSRWYPNDAALGLWATGISRTIAVTGADPDMGANLAALALGAGFAPAQLRFNASCWSFGGREDVQFWGESCAARMGKGSDLRKKIVGLGESGTTDEDVDAFVSASLAWALKPGAWFGCMNGELLVFK